MKNEVIILPNAERDIFDIFKFISKNDSPSRAEKIYKNITEVIMNLSTFLNLGHYNSEMENIGNYGYKEVHFNPYRIIYHIDNSTIYIQAVLDSRRNIEDLLQERLLR